MLSCLVLISFYCSSYVLFCFVHQPDESMADDFLFPMTSRMSYTSSPDSDGEFCEPETPSISRQPSMVIDPAKLERYNSDPNLTARSLNTSGMIPDYNMPPPNSAINLTLSTKVIQKIGLIALIKK